MKEQDLVFNDWISRYRALIFRIVRAYAFNVMDRDDLFQEIAIQLWRSVVSFKGQSGETTWIYRVALNTAIKWVRKEKKNLREGSLDDTHYVVQEREYHDMQLEWLYGEIGKLKPIDRSVTLLLLDDFSYKEIAAILGITESNVGVKINRIKKYLVLKSKNYDQHGI